MIKVWSQLPDGTILNPDETYRICSKEDNSVYDNSSEVPNFYRLFTDSQDILEFIERYPNSDCWLYIDKEDVSGILCFSIEWFEIAYAIESNQPYLVSNPIWRIV